jgi:CRP-like cAMP-binding protein
MDHYILLSETLQQAQKLSPTEAEAIAQSFEFKELPKNGYFQESGKRCSKIGFLTSGILRSYIDDQKGNEIVKHFIEPKQFFTDLESYEKATRAHLNIQAVVNASILFITKEKNEQLAAELPSWNFLLKSFSADALRNMIQTQNFLHFGSALEKYRYFLSHHPNLAQQVPLRDIASYLGITQSSLSRIRREI